MEILIAGDLVPTKVNYKYFKEGNSLELLGKDLHSIWNSADYRIFNLEVPLFDEQNPIRKNGPNLIAPSNTIKGIKDLNPSLITLANNHILDQGVKGLDNTIKLLNGNEILYVGAGKDISQAAKPYIFKKNGVRIGVYTCAENEFTIATDKSAGANPFDPLESLDHINMLKSKCDFLIVLYHGGKEHYRYPSPYLQKVCRKIVQKGADLVVCQHSHAIGAYEKFEESTIIYGQGNFIFNRDVNECWDTSLIIRLSINNKVSLDYLPILRTNKGISLAKGKEAKKILDGFFGRSSDILNEDFVETRYQQFGEERINSYLRNFSSYGKWISMIDRKLLNNYLLKRKYNKKKLLILQNFIECEAHRELLLKGITEVIKNGR